MVSPVQITKTFNGDTAAADLVNAAQLDTQLSNVALTLNQEIAARQLTLRDGGGLANQVVGFAALKAEVITSLSGLTFLQNVQAATTTNDTLSGLAPRDGYTPSSGDRILVDTQTNPVQNGIYVAAAGAWSFAPDYFGSLTTAIAVSVVNGVAYQGTTWRLAATTTVGSTAATWIQIVGQPSVLPIGRGGTGAVTAPLARVALGVNGTILANVKDSPYLAIGDGAADDTTAINAAITAVSAAGGGIVFLPTGTYKITSNINMASNVSLRGSGPTSIIKVAADTVLGAVKCLGINNFSVIDLAIDGGGQTVDVATGFKACQAINVNACTYFVIERVSISKCGIKNGASPGVDAAFAGLGIVIGSLSGECAYGVVKDCRIRLIAGGGVANGDGIAIAGGGGASVLVHDILVDSCWVSTCGRHCYSESGIIATGLPRNITFRKCYAEKSGLSGIDIEDGTRSSLLDNRYSNCGNDQTYYNPASLYGATYALIAAIAVGQNSSDITIRDCRADTCYYGITYSNAQSLKMDGCTFESGLFDDILIRGAQGARMRITNCDFLSTVNAIQVSYLSADTKDILYFGYCTFATQVKIGQSQDLCFDGCGFLAGVLFTTTGSARISFSDCNFEDFVGSAITHSVVSQSVADVVVDRCRFNGLGNLVNGIVNQYGDALGWRITNNLFQGLTGAGITHGNGNGQACYSRISGNKFKSCVTGIVANQAIINGIISENVFESITGWCIDLSGISAGVNMLQMTIMNNVAGASVTNGLRIALTTGTWDWTLLAYNDMHLATGTKWTIPGGNANGFTVNNLTT